MLIGSFSCNTGNDYSTQFVAKEMLEILKENSNKHFRLTNYDDSYMDIGVSNETTLKLKGIRNSSQCIYYVYGIK